MLIGKVTSFFGQESKIRVVLRRLKAFARVSRNWDGLNNWASYQAEKRSSRTLETWMMNTRMMPHFLRRYVDENITKALAFFIIRENALEFKHEIGRQEPYNFQMGRFPDRYAEYVGELECISKKGLLKVLLTVYLKLLPDLVGKDEERRSRVESLRIFKFVASLASLDKWLPNEVLFDGDLTHFVIVPVAARYPSSIDFYEKRIEKYGLRNNIDAIFVLAIGIVNSLVAASAVQSFHEKNVEKFSISTKNGYRILSHDGSEKEAVTIFLRRNSKIH